MTVLRCSAKLRKRMGQAAKPPEPAAGTNPLGEWYADVDFWHRQPFIVMLNAATGAVLALPSNAAGLRRLNERALLQFASLCGQTNLSGPQVDAELAGLDAGFTIAATRDRSLVASLNQRKEAIWLQLEYNGLSLAEAAAREWDGFFQHPSLGKNKQLNSPWHRPLDLLREKLSPSLQSILALRIVRGNGS